MRHKLVLLAGDVTLNNDYALWDGQYVSKLAFLVCGEVGRSETGTAGAIVV
jgi:hypothetical protein